MEYLPLLASSLGETLIMVGVATLLGIVLGCPLGILLFTTHPKGIKPNRLIYNIFGFSVNAARSVPYIILMVLMIPLTRFVVGSSIGTAGAIVPLAFAAMLLFARLMEDSLLAVPKGLIEMGVSMGSGTLQLIRFIALPECLPQFINGATTITINIIGFSAMAGAVGGGGLGDLAVRYGYQRYNVVLMWFIVLVLVVLVQVVQMAGQYLYRCVNKA
jgi:D-methionine transport system permease protein